MTTENTSLHLWFKPFNGILADTDVPFTDRYSRRFYPRALHEVGRALRKAVVAITAITKPGTFEYQMRHYTTVSNGRYVIEESLRELANDQGFCLGIQATTAPERKLINQCVADELPDLRMQPVANVIAYLEDSIASESERWIGSRMYDGQEALPVMTEVIAFLKSIKSLAMVFEFSMSQGETGTVMTLVLVTQGVMSYYTRLDWVIV